MKVYTEEFDYEMHYQANIAGYESIKDNFIEVVNNHQKKPYFLRNAKYVPPSFVTVPTDLEDMMDVGRLVDNCEFTKPLILMNTYNFEFLEFTQKLKSFERVHVEDEKNIIDTLPKYFKSILLSTDEVALLGGYDYAISNSSKNVFYIINGRILKANPMFTARQYFSLCIDQQNSFLYVIGGYNKEKGVIPHCERLSLKSKQWQEIEDLNVGRLNSCSAALNGTHVYTFGGLGQFDYLSSIERYNTQLNIWSELKIKMPSKISNAMA